MADGSLERATIARVDGSGVYVHVPRLDATFALGPVLVAAPGLGLDPESVGDGVVVGLLGGSIDDLVILGRI